MVKTNRFMLISCTGGLPLTGIFIGFGVPIIAAEKHNTHLKGYVYPFFSVVLVR
jgi:hypothetical protein